MIDTEQNRSQTLGHHSIIVQKNAKSYEDINKKWITMNNEVFNDHTRTSIDIGNFEVKFYQITVQ